MGVDTKSTKRHQSQNCHQNQISATSIRPQPRGERELERFRSNLIEVQQWPKSPIPIPDSPPNGVAWVAGKAPDEMAKTMEKKPLPHIFRGFP